MFLKFLSNFSIALVCTSSVVTASVLYRADLYVLGCYLCTTLSLVCRFSCNGTCVFQGRDSVVGTETRYELDVSSFEPR